MNPINYQIGYIEKKIKTIAKKINDDKKIIGMLYTKLSFLKTQSNTINHPTLKEFNNKGVL